MMRRHGWLTNSSTRWVLRPVNHAGSRLISRVSTGKCGLLHLATIVATPGFFSSCFISFRVLPTYCIYLVKTHFTAYPHATFELSFTTIDSRHLPSEEQPGTGGSAKLRGNTSPLCL